MLLPASRTLERTRTHPHTNGNPNHINGHHQLFVKIRNLLRSNQPIEASNLFIKTAEHHQVNNHTQDWLWKTANLFRSYNHPQLAFELFQRLKSHNLPIPVKATVSAVQACSHLAWNSHHHHGWLNGRIQFNPHAHLAESLISLLTTTPHHHVTSNSQPSECAVQEFPRKEKNENQASLLTHQDTLNSTSTRVLEVILSNVLKLGDMDWMLSIFVNFYPNYTHELGLYLYPPTSNQTNEKTSITTDTKLKLNEIPSGRLIKFLVKGYMMCKDFKRAHLVVKFHQAICDQQQSTGLIFPENSVRDLSPEITLLRGLSRIKIGSLERRMKMVGEILSYLSSHPIYIDTYVLDALLETRFRLRTGWEFVRTQLSTFEVIRSIVEDHLKLFLIHWSRQKSFANSHQTTGLIHGQYQGQRIVSSWRYRPSALTFTILLISLRNYLRFQTRPIIANSYHSHQHSSDSQPDYLQQETLQKPKKRRPSPGPHRSVVAQILGFENLNHLACPINTNQDWNVNQTTCLPNQFRLLTTKNLILLVENLLLARDYPCIWILLESSGLLKLDHDHDDLLSEISKMITSKLERVIKSGGYLEEDGFTTDLLVELKTYQQYQRQDLTKLIQTCLKLAFHIDSSFQIKISKKIDGFSWDSEITCIQNRFQLEFKKIFLIHSGSSSFSEFTLDFLRKEVGKNHLDRLFYGLPQS